MPFQYDHEHKPTDQLDFDLPTLHQLVEDFQNFVRELLEKRKPDAKD